MANQLTKRLRAFQQRKIYAYEVEGRATIPAISLLPSGGRVFRAQACGFERTVSCLFAAENIERRSVNCTGNNYSPEALAGLEVYAGAVVWTFGLFRLRLPRLFSTLRTPLRLPRPFRLPDSFAAPDFVSYPELFFA
jgi:hypothetical protein